MLFLKYKHFKLKLRVFLAGHKVAMVTHCVTKMKPMCSPMIGQLFDTMIVAIQLIKSGNNDPSKSTSWKVLEPVLSHLNYFIAVISLLQQLRSRKLGAPYTMDYM